MYLFFKLTVVLWESTHEAKVSDLHPVSRGKQDVAAGQVTMDEPLGLQVGHAFGDLDGILPYPVDGDPALSLEHTRVFFRQTKILWETAVAAQNTLCK